VPAEPEPTPWRMPGPTELAGCDDLVAVGADLEPGTLLAAYRHGLFPMPLDDERIGWWSPDPRGVLPIDALSVSRSLRRSVRRYDIRVDTAFDQVVRACADPARPHGWISEPIAAAYSRLHGLGWAHSVEAWDGERLVGGLYGLAIDGLFAGESMFSLERDASKVALVALVDLLKEDGRDRLIDVQWTTEHLESLGVLEVSRPLYLDLLAAARGIELPPAFA